MRGTAHDIPAEKINLREDEEKMIRPITFEEQIVGSKTDGGLYRNVYPHDGILWGCGITAANTEIEIASGMFVLCGRIIWVDGKTVFPVKNPIQNGYVRLKAKIDLNAASTQEECGQFATEVEFSTTTLFPELTQEDINNTGKVYEQELVVAKIEAGNVTGITRKIGNAEIDAEKLGGQLPAFYAKKTEVDLKAPKANPTFSGTATAPAIVANTSMSSPNYLIPGGAVITAENGILIISRGSNSSVQIRGSEISFKNSAATSLAPIHTSVINFGGECSVTSTANGNALIIQGGSSNSLQLRGADIRCTYADGGSNWCNVYGKSFTNPSTRDTKRDIAALEDAEALKLLNVAVCNFIYKSDDENKVQNGVIAEDIKELGIENVLTYDVDGELFGVDYSKFTPALIRLCQMQQQQIDVLKKSTNALSAILVAKGVCTQEEMDGMGGETK